VSDLAGGGGQLENGGVGEFVTATDSEGAKGWARGNGDLDDGCVGEFVDII